MNDEKQNVPVLFVGPDRPELRRKILAATAGNPTAPGTAGILRIQHDDWRALLTEDGDCDCDPNIFYERVKP